MTQRTAALFLLLFFSHFSAQAGEDSFEKSFDVTPGGKVLLRTDFGDVTITGTGGSTVQVFAKLTGSRSEIEEFEITAEERNGTVEVRGKGGDNGWWSRAFEDLSVSFTIQVPDHFNADVSTSGGDVVITGITGIVVGETSGGDVMFRMIEGDMKAETSGGDIVAEDVKGQLRAETSGGDVSISGAVGNVATETSGGDITVRAVRGNVRAETSGGDIRIALSGENKGVIAETSGGDIEIYTTREMRADLDASTSGGSVVCGLPITLAGEVDESRVRGTLNGGGEVIHARTSGGDIRIKELE